MTAWSLRRRVTMAVAALVAAAVAALAWMVLAVVERAAWRQVDAGLDQRALAWSALVEHDVDGYEMELPPAAPAARAVFVEVWCPDDQVLARSPSLGAADLPRLADATSRTVTLPDGRRGRARGFAFVPRREDHAPVAPCRLVLAEGTEDVRAMLATTRAWVVGLGLATLALTLLITASLIGRALAPLTTLGRQLAAIDGDTLAARVTLVDPPRELAGPVATLNLLLARLEDAFARERAITADVSHELRTPLAGLRTLLEVTELTAAEPAAYRAAIASALAIVADLTRLVENLLALARAERGQLPVAAAPVPLRELLDALWLPHAAAAAARDLRFDNRVAADVVVTTDRELAAVVLTNLLANAAAYTERGGWIAVTATAGAIDIADSGPPLTAVARAHLFDRFWRGDDARADTGTHAGIGLALARSVARVLGWTVDLADRSDGAVVFRVSVDDQNLNG